MIQQRTPHSQHGTSLVEMLVSILILSFGLLSLAGMLSFSVQMPKLSGYRSTATNLASDYIERIRANRQGWENGRYVQTQNFTGGFGGGEDTPFDCDFNCDEAQMSRMDNEQMFQRIRNELPAGSVFINCGPAGAGCMGPQTFGEIWIMWLEPATVSQLAANNSDQCPAGAVPTELAATTRCLYLRFTL